MLNKIVPTALAAAMLVAAGSTGVAHAKTDVVYIGGTGTTPSYPTTAPAGFVTPFVPDPDATLAVPAVDAGYSRNDVKAKDSGTTTKSSTPAKASDDKKESSNDE